MCVSTHKSLAKYNTLISVYANGNDAVNINVFVCASMCARVCIYTHYTYVIFSDVNKLPLSIDRCFTVQELPVDIK